MLHSFRFILVALACLSFSEIAHAICVNHVKTKGSDRIEYRDPSPECNRGDSGQEPVSVDFSPPKENLGYRWTSPLAENYIVDQHSAPPSAFAPGAMGEKGPIVANAIVNVFSTVSLAMHKFAEADLERAMRFQPQPGYSGMTPAQKEREYQSFYRRLDQELKEATDKINEQRIDEDKQKEVLDSIRAISTRIKSIRSLPHFQERKFSKVPRPETTIPVEFETEGLSDEQIDFLQDAASEAAALKVGENTYEQGSDRWKDRFERAQRYWRDENFRKVYAKVKLSDSAKRMFRLSEILSDSFEHYEIISVANQLSRDRKLGDPFREMYISLALRQAHQFAQDGDFYASAKMVENALSDRDFAHGTVKGLFQNVRDTVTGLWHLVRHPIESAKALANAIVNFEQTVEILAEKLDKILTEFPYYDEQKKGEVLGYLATEIGLAIGTGGVSLASEVAKIAKVSEAVAIATEETLKTLNAVKQLNRFEAAYTVLSDLGKANVEFLRNFAKRNDWAPKPNILGGPEEWGVYVDGKFKWRIKIKPEASLREGLERGSQIPRASVRLGDDNYLNPFTNEKCTAKVAGHLPLEYEWGI
jgi:hypothetical protein